MGGDKKSTGISRRDLLFGAMKKLRREDEWQEIREEQKAQSKKTGNLLEAGNALMERGDYQGAVEKYRICLEQDSSLTEAHRRLGYCLYRLGQYIQAKVEFERVLYNGKRDNYSSLYLGLCQARLDKAEKAATAWKGYFNPEEIDIQREINIQLAMLEAGEGPSARDMADAVEDAVDRRKRELYKEQGP